jgi:5'(3')-deoxyribonucleotidase
MRFKEYIEFINESEKTIQFFFDMDGVLADFEGGIEKDPRYKEVIKAKEDLFKYVAKNHPEVKNMHIDDVKPILPKGNKELKHLYDIAHDIIHEIADQKGFFLNLEVLPGAKEMLQTAKAITGKLPDIATAPTDSTWCESEKKEWLKKHFTGMYDKVYVDKNKGKIVKSKNDVLIDDRLKYTKMFNDAGGTSILHTNWKDTIKKMKI